MTRIKAIETRYAGHRFRSRLEARWAVFFDALGVEWRYEPEGFETSAGWYLPDFYFPEYGRWVEIKGGRPTARDLERGAAFAEAKWQIGEGYRFLIGDIPLELSVLSESTADGIPALSRALGRFKGADSAPVGIPALSYSQLYYPLPLAPEDDWTPPETFTVTTGSYLNHPAATRGWTSSFWRPATGSPKEVNAALVAARSARFEHGETPHVS